MCKARTPRNYRTVCKRVQSEIRCYTCTWLHPNSQYGWFTWPPEPRANCKVDQTWGCRWITLEFTLAFNEQEKMFSQIPESLCFSNFYGRVEGKHFLFPVLLLLNQYKQQNAFRWWPKPGMWATFGGKIKDWWQYFKNHVGWQNLQGWRHPHFPLRMQVKNTWLILNPCIQVS